MLHRTHRLCNNNHTGTTSEPPADWTEVWVWILLNTNWNCEAMYSLITLRWSLVSAREERKQEHWVTKQRTQTSEAEGATTTGYHFHCWITRILNTRCVLWRSIIFVCNLPSTGNNRSIMAGSLTMLNSALLDLLFPLPNKRDRSGSSYVPYAATNQRPPDSSRTVLIRILSNILITAVRFQYTCLI
jgi:hypothetical protein